jgi:hypothetical protein
MLVFARLALVAMMLLQPQQQQQLQSLHTDDAGLHERLL